MQSMQLNFRLGMLSDEAQVISLVNSVYRGESAEELWTTEAKLIDGPRIDSKSFADLIAPNDSFLILAFYENELVGCVHLRKSLIDCLLGMLSVKAAFQKFGLGKVILSYAEEYALANLGIHEMSMHVITVRSELLNWYQRRGYKATGEVVPFNGNNGLNKPKSGSLYFAVLKKVLT